MDLVENDRSVLSDYGRVASSSQKLRGTLWYSGLPLNISGIQAASMQNYVCKDKVRLFQQRTISIGRSQLPRRTAMLIGLVLGVYSASLYATPPSPLDPRVTQSSIARTICHRDYLTKVMPSIDARIRRKSQLLGQLAIAPELAPRYALDLRMPVLLGGSPDAKENFDLVPWDGPDGERRKRRFTVFLNRCVCAGEMRLARAQAAWSGDWANRYSNLWTLQCRDVADAE
ncbi:hypothetical protein ACT2FY_36555 [Paraburkholderia fungorum]|uniref:hypothetical protein n=1 Tax=Paraburkholderia fungorum TaxID=134537 RepID=UPI00402B8CA5